MAEPCSAGTALSSLLLHTLHTTVGLREQGLLTAGSWLFVPTQNTRQGYEEEAEAQSSQLSCLQSPRGSWILQKPQMAPARVTQSPSFVSVKDPSHYASSSNCLGCKLDFHHSWDKNLTLLRSLGVWASISVAPWLQGFAWAMSSLEVTTVYPKNIFNQICHQYWQIAAVQFCAIFFCPDATKGMFIPKECGW